MSIHYTNKHHIPFKVDDEDNEIVIHYSWFLGNKGYITITVPNYKIM